jgi:peptidoglycan/LPS O-acetylase OafA/YrhL
MTDRLRGGRYLESGDEAGTSPSDRKFRPDVEGLRAVAILLVLLSHFNIPGFLGGFLGVDVFFVISGFVITGLLMRGRAASGRIQLADFFARRCRRIIPVAAVVIVLTVVLERVTGGRAFAHILVFPAQLMLLFVFNWSPVAVTQAFLAPSNIAIFWSLCVEEQFYLVYPLLLIGIALLATRASWRTKANIAIGAVTIASFAWTVAESSQGWSVYTYVSTFGRVWELGLGCLLAVNLRWFLKLPLRLSAGVGWSGLVLIALAVATLRAEHGAYPGWPALLPTFGVALVIIGGSPVPRWGPERFLGLRPMRRIGQWSYGAYLWEIPVIALIYHWWGGVLAIPIAARFAFLAVTLGVAGLSFAFLESPIRHSTALVRSPRRSFLVAGAITGVSLLLVTLAGSYS